MRKVFIGITVAIQSMYGDVRFEICPFCNLCFVIWIQQSSVLVNQITESKKLESQTHSENFAMAETEPAQTFEDAVESDQPIFAEPLISNFIV